MSMGDYQMAQLGQLGALNAMRGGNGAGGEHKPKSAMVGGASRTPFSHFTATQYNGNTAIGYAYGNWENVQGSVLETSVETLDNGVIIDQSFYDAFGTPTTTQVNSITVPTGYAAPAPDADLVSGRWWQFGGTVYEPAADLYTCVTACWYDPTTAKCINSCASGCGMAACNGGCGAACGGACGKGSYVPPFVAGGCGYGAGGGGGWNPNIVARDMSATEQSKYDEAIEMVLQRLREAAEAYENGDTARGDKLRDRAEILWRSAQGMRRAITNEAGGNDYQKHYDEASLRYKFAYVKAWIEIIKAVRHDGAGLKAGPSPGMPARSHPEAVFVPLGVATVATGVAVGAIGADIAAGIARWRFNQQIIYLTGRLFQITEAHGIEVTFNILYRMSRLPGGVVIVEAIYRMTGIAMQNPASQESFNTMKLVHEAIDLLKRWPGWPGN